MIRAVAQDDVRCEVDAVNRRFREAYYRGDPESMASVYTEDAVLLPPDEPMVNGRANIGEFWGALMGAGVRDITLETVSLAGSGDWRHEIGRAIITVDAGGGENITQITKYVTIWQRDGGGWACAVGIWNGARLVN